MKWLGAILKRYFLTGLLVLIPISLCIYIVKIVITAADRFLRFLPPAYNPGTYLPVHIPGLGIILTVAVIFLVGLVTANFVGKKVVHGIEYLFARIPLVRTIYTGAKEIVQTIVLDRPSQFRQVVLIEYPRRGIYSIAFVTSSPSGELAAKVNGDFLNVFIPTTPNPTSGFFILVSREETIPLNITIEDAFKLIMSAGISMPTRQIKLREEVGPEGKRSLLDQKTG
ncbi:MAG: DUF502 domain-containing protein [Thermodesulfobacteriota bacterium]